LPQRHAPQSGRGKPKASREQSSRIRASGHGKKTIYSRESWDYNFVTHQRISSGNFVILDLVELRFIFLVLCGERMKQIKKQKGQI